jgi:tetratricopeptide (TPR) repeat protein
MLADYHDTCRWTSFARKGSRCKVSRQGKPDLALPHLQKAISLNSENEVAQYQLSKVYKALGRPVEQQKALNEF